MPGGPGPWARLLIIPATTTTTTMPTLPSSIFTTSITTRHWLIVKISTGKPLNCNRPFKRSFFPPSSHPSCCSSTLHHCPTICEKSKSSLCYVWLFECTMRTVLNTATTLDKSKNCASLEIAEEDCSSADVWSQNGEVPGRAGGAGKRRCWFQGRAINVIISHSSHCWRESSHCWAAALLESISSTSSHHLTSLYFQKFFFCSCKSWESHVLVLIE